MIFHNIYLPNRYLPWTSNLNSRTPILGTTYLFIFIVYKVITYRQTGSCITVDKRRFTLIFLVIIMRLCRPTLVRLSGCRGLR